MKRLFAISAAAFMLSSGMLFAQGQPSGDAGEQSNAMNRQPDEEGHNWGLLGLVGLAGLAGLRRSERQDISRRDDEGSDIHPKRVA